MPDENQGGLSASEAAYFESGGNTEVIPEAAPPPAAIDGAPPAAEPGGPTAELPAGERDEKGRFVPHQALHAEREEHKKTKSALEEISRKQAVLEDRWNTILKLKEPAKEEPVAPPDPNEDIFAFSKWQADQLKALSEKVESRDKQEEQARTVAEQERGVWNEWSQSATAYAAEKADFGDAVKFLSDARTKQLAAFGTIDPNFANEQGRLNQINNELRQIVLTAKQAGQNPAAVVYEIAAAYGYAPAAPDPGKLELPDKLAQIDAAQNASRTLTTAGGRNATEPMTAEAIASMQPHEFEAWMKAPGNERLFAKIMGG
ncbi:hypothetical protein ELG76_04160 [Rhizobium leguminosarum]|uniref:hypothetical protein n=1 Tax=Rhizobium leguminosarum TaxID=384 RepID=UPI001030AAFE|nr:hypothetical protein [Rhizobium leguminosarum]TBG78614.1 hypothetical protein ELG76_04160 [Rhizobium leguminosarum]